MGVVQRICCFGLRWFTLCLLEHTLRLEAAMVQCSRYAGVSYPTLTSIYSKATHVINQFSRKNLLCGKSAQTPSCAACENVFFFLKPSNQPSCQVIHNTRKTSALRVMYIYIIYIYIYMINNYLCQNSYCIHSVCAKNVNCRNQSKHKLANAPSEIFSRDVFILKSIVGRER